MTNRGPSSMCRMQTKTQYYNRLQTMLQDVYSHAFVDTKPITMLQDVYSHASVGTEPTAYDTAVDAASWR